jgi:ectoine hydroxylase-related dioxygenase (phytanoyl-CoA dioxygenase family)
MNEIVRYQPTEVEARLDEIVQTLLTGAGAIVIADGFDEASVAQARTLLLHYSDIEGGKVTHFQGANTGRLDRQRRVWNLLNKGDVFEAMAQHPQVMTIASPFLGDAFQMGSIAANRLLPGGPGQEPHLDYPYWDLHERSSFPTNINSSFPMNLQATILIDDFTEANGATAFVPHSQGDLRYPDDRAAFDRSAIRMIGRAGDIVVFNGMCWHCAMPNESDADRIGVLVEYLPKFVRPLEDHSVVHADVIARATPMLRQLLGIDYPYPQVLDKADAVNAEGRE